MTIKRMLAKAKEELKTAEDTIKTAEDLSNKFKSEEQAFLDEQEQEMNRMYEVNLLNPSINRFEGIISDAISSYLVWLRSQNSTALNTFSVSEMLDYYINKIEKPDLVEYSLKHAPENTLASIYEAIVKGIENQEDFTNMSAKYPVVSLNKTFKGQKIDYADYSLGKSKRTSPSEAQLNILKGEYGDYTLPLPVALKINRTDASTMIGVLFDGNVLWTPETRKKAREKEKLMAAQRNSKGWNRK